MSVPFLLPALLHLLYPADLSGFGGNDLSATQRQVKTLNIQAQDQTLSKTGTGGRQVHLETTTETGQVKSEPGEQITKCWNTAYKTHKTIW